MALSVIIIRFMGGGVLDYYINNNVAPNKGNRVFLINIINL